jgi:excisionase family DNA binding protein
MNILDRLRAIVAPLPTGAAVTLPADALREWLDAYDTEPAAEQPATPAGADLTVPEVAKLFGRGKSTVRGWIAEGSLPGAYLLKGREWRVPRAAVEAMQRAEAERHAAAKPARAEPRRKDADLGAWRQHMPGGKAA